MEEPSGFRDSTTRHLVWGGLAARCSGCGWIREYEPSATIHRLPGAELSETISAEFHGHDCKEFPMKKSQGHT